MRKWIAIGMASVVASLLVSFCGDERVIAQDKKNNPPKFLYGHDLRVRLGGKPDFDKDTPRIGVEFYLDEDTNALIAISESGALSVAPAGQVGTDHTSKWLTAHDLGSRKAGEQFFTQKTKKYGVELFRDLGTNELLYISETGSVALAPVPAGLVTEKGPKFHHSFEPHLRAPEQTSFEHAKKICMEVFKDENTGGLLYISEIGAIAAAPAPATAPDPQNPTPPKAAYGWNLRVRGADELDFGDKTKRIGVEIFEDPNVNNQLLYITEAGYLSIAPNPGKFADLKSVTWKAAMNLKVRKGGEKAFNKDTKKFGIEVFVDNRTGNLVYVSETGSIAVLPKQ